MGTIFLFVVILFFAASTYIGLVLYKKKINIKDIRVHNINDAKKLLMPPGRNGALKYLEKAA